MQKLCLKRNLQHTMTFNAIDTVHHIMTVNYLSVNYQLCRKKNTEYTICRIIGTSVETSQH